jgi:hypothetical protein
LFSSTAVLELVDQKKAFYSTYNASQIRQRDQVADTYELIDNLGDVLQCTGDFKNVDKAYLKALNSQLKCFWQLPPALR